MVAPGKKLGYDNRNDCFKKITPYRTNRLFNHSGLSYHQSRSVYLPDTVYVALLIALHHRQKYLTGNIDGPQLLHALLTPFLFFP